MRSATVRSSKHHRTFIHDATDTTAFVHYRGLSSWNRGAGAYYLKYTFIRSPIIKNLGNCTGAYITPLQNFLTGKSGFVSKVLQPTRELHGRAWSLPGGNREKLHVLHYTLEVCSIRFWGGFFRLHPLR